MTGPLSPLLSNGLQTLQHTGNLEEKLLALWDEAIPTIAACAIGDLCCCYTYHQPSLRYADTFAIAAAVSLGTLKNGLCDASKVSVRISYPLPTSSTIIFWICRGIALSLVV